MIKREKTIMKVTLLTNTPEPQKTVTAAAMLCYSKAGADEIIGNITEENVEKFLNRLMSMGHESPVEHVSFTFAIEGVSRVLSHQLVRHRIASYSQKSQRYVNEGQFNYIIPPEIEKDTDLAEVFNSTMEFLDEKYTHLVSKLTEKYVATGMKPMDAEKKSMEDARYVLPNACETKIVTTMNVRTLLHFFNQRCCDRAQWEIRDMANEMMRICKEIAPLLFKNAGAPCVSGSCHEGAMSCKNPKK